MKKRWMIAVLAAGLAAAAGPALAQASTVADDETVERALAAQKGKRVTVMFAQRGEMTGVVKLVTPQVVHLSEPAGKEFYDAAIDTRSVTAVVVRAKN